MKRCLFCYKELKGGENDFHAKCSKKIFGYKDVPIFDYSKDKIQQLAEMVIRSHSAVPGVQAKLSLNIEKGSLSEPKRFTIVGLWGCYMLKPQSEMFKFLPELEDLTMHLAEKVKIATVPHSLFRFEDGDLCYVTKRIDRGDSGEKYAMEDMCQLTYRLTEYKYKGSYEQIAKEIIKYSSAPILDLVNFWEIVIFSWITGNADMHLKNFSLYALDVNIYRLTPAYDLLSTALVMLEDNEELALHLNGKKRKITKNDFILSMKGSGVDEKIIGKIFQKFIKSIESWFDIIDSSFIPNEMKVQYKNLILLRIDSLK